MNNETRLNEILTICERNLALAEKRTKGEWPMISSINLRVCGPVYDTNLNHDDCRFIAACAGSAEAGWLSTIAVIRGPISTPEARSELLITPANFGCIHHFPK